MRASERVCMYVCLGCNAIKKINTIVRGGDDFLLNARNRGKIDHCAHALVYITGNSLPDDINKYTSKDVCSMKSNSFYDTRFIPLVIHCKVMLAVRFCLSGQ